MLLRGLFSCCCKSKPMKKVILILCGSFNPITRMHIQMFQLAKDRLENLGIEVVGGVVSPVHDNYGKPGLASQVHRIAMIKLALESCDWIKISEWESQQDEWTKTRTVLEHHQKVLNFILKSSNASRVLPSWIPENIQQGSKLEIQLLCGADLLESFSKTGLWDSNDIQAILTQGIVLIERKGSDPKKIISRSNLLCEHRKKIIIVPSKTLQGSPRGTEVSSTIARNNISKDLPVQNFLHNSVIKYIEENELYQNN